MQEGHDPTSRESLLSSPPREPLDPATRKRRLDIAGYVAMVVAWLALLAVAPTPHTLLVGALFAAWFGIPVVTARFRWPLARASLFVSMLAVAFIAGSTLLIGHPLADRIGTPGLVGVWSLAALVAGWVGRHGGRER